MTNHPSRRRIAKYNSAVRLGDTVYLVRRENPDSGTTELCVQIEAPITNMNRETRIDGWLGTVNNIAAYAMGKVVLTKWGAKNGEVHFRAVLG